jgi:hypothetical protein
VRQGPLLLHLPDPAGRYRVMQFVDASTKSFAYVGRRTSRTSEGSFLPAAEVWAGELPAFRPVIRMYQQRSAVLNGTYVLPPILKTR